VTPSAVTFDGVAHAFPARGGEGVLALSGITLDVARGEFLAVVGPSGCGKSTLLRMVAGLLRPSRGAVSIYGRPVDEPRDEIGFVFQKPTLLPWHDVLGNVLFPLRHKYGRATAADRDRARALLAMAGLQGFENRLPEELSGGMQQRVAIARALLLEPEIMLMDEPFSALDALTREEMGFELLRLWQQRPHTVIFVTHNIGEAVLLADRVVVMSPRPGRVRTIVDVELPRPRRLESLSDPRFHEHTQRIRALVLDRAAAPA